MFPQMYHVVWVCDDTSLNGFSYLMMMILSIAESLIAKSINDFRL